MIWKVRIGKKEEEALIDDGSEVSLMKSTTFKELESVSDDLEESDLIINQANGQEIQLNGNVSVIGENSGCEHLVETLYSIKL